MEIFAFLLALRKAVLQCLAAPGEICPRDVWSSAQEQGSWFFSIKKWTSCNLEIHGCLWIFKLDLKSCGKEYSELSL